MSDEQETSWLSEMGSALGICSEEPAASAVDDSAPDDEGTDDGMCMDESSKGVPQKDDYNQGYQDGLSGSESCAIPRDGEALEQYEQGYKKGRAEYEGFQDSGPSESNTLLVTVCFEDGTAADGAQVVIVGCGSTALTDSGGKAYLSDIPTGSFWINASYGELTGEMAASSDLTQVGIILQGLHDGSDGEETCDEDTHIPTYEDFAATAQRMQSARNNVASSAQAVDNLANRLKSPDGARGLAYQIVAGTMGLAAAGKDAYDYSKDKVDKVADPKGTVQSEVEDTVLGIEPESGPSFDEVATKFGERAGTSYKLMTGQLNQIYQNTRATYGAYTAALGAFDQAYQAAMSSPDTMAMASSIVTLASRLKALCDAANQFLMACDVNGIRQYAHQLQALDNAIVAAIQSTVSDAVGALDPVTDVPKKIGEQLTK